MLALLAVALFAAAFSAVGAQAQIVGSLEVNIPFQFHAGNTKLPAGKYVIHALDESDPSVMEIRSENGSTSALFEVVDAQANSAPAKSELVFNKYGNHYFLSKLFEEGNTYGDQVPKSRYEKRLSQETPTGQEHIAASRQQQASN